MYNLVNYELTVTSIIDGDKIKVVTKYEKKSLKIRLACIDSPEIKQSWGDKA